MKETVQSPIAREALIHWIEDIYRPYIDVQQSGGAVLRLQHDDGIFPEIDVLFYGDPKNFQDTVEIGGMYDHKAHSFHFMSGQMVSAVDGLSEEELHAGDGTSESVYEEIRQYAERAIKEWGYQYNRQTDADYEGFRQTMRSALSAMTKYAALLVSRGEQPGALDIRNMVAEMLHFWRDPIYDVYERGYQAVERQYLEQFDQTVASPAASGQSDAFSAVDAKAIFQGLTLHAGEVEQNENAFSVWRCCRLAERLGKEYPEEMELFHGNFTPNYDRQYDSPDRQEHAYNLILFDKQVILVDHPVPKEQVPKNWNTYHLAGSCLEYAEWLSTVMPAVNYIGTVVTPHVLIRNGSQWRKITETLFPVELYSVPYPLPQTDSPIKQGPQIGEMDLQTESRPAGRGEAVTAGQSEDVLMGDGLDYNVYTKVSFQLGFDGQGNFNILLLPNIQRAFVQHVKKVFKEDETLGSYITDELNFRFDGCRVDLVYKFPCHDESKAAAEEFSSYSLRRVQKELETFGCKLTQVSCEAVKVSTRWLDKLEDAVFGPKGQPRQGGMEMM